VSGSCTNLVPLTETSSEKYLKRLAGRTDMEDALKRLDKLTQEEARMAIAQNLKATHAVDDRVGVVIDRVLNVDDRVASVGDGVKAVNDKVSVVIDGTQTIFVGHQSLIHLHALDGREAKVVMRQTANDVDHVKRS